MSSKVDLKDGYYLSLYVAIGELTHLNGLFVKHDQNMALWKKQGNKIHLVRFWELERVTGLKQHNRSFYDVAHLKRVVDELLAPMSLRFEDMEGFFGYPELDYSDFYRKDIPKDIAFHSILHMYAGLFVNSDTFFNGKLLCLSVDGGPDSVIDDGESKRYHYCGIYVDHGKTEGVYHLISPGILWAYMAKKFGLREGTLMALGSATTARLIQADYDAVFDIYNDRQGELRFFSYIDQLYDRVKKLTREDEGTQFTQYDERFSLEENQLSMVVKVIQQISINIMEKNVQEAIEKFGIVPEETTLCISGGYALNCGTNSFLMQKYGFKEFVAPPCVNDSGLSLGLGLFIFYKAMGYFEFALENAYHGIGFEKIPENTLKQFENYIETMECVDDARIVDDIINYPIVWFDGNAEIGPRALGHRSLIADPRTYTAKDILNEVKMRQWWRPVAPIIMLNHLSEWFEGAIPSPFMLQTFLVKKEKRDLVPAIKHLDDSARVQTMEESDNPRLYHVLEIFNEKTGVPILCNTSLNDRGEPIINSVDEAINFALRKRIPVIYVNGIRIKLKNHEQYDVPTYLKRPINFMVFADEEERQKLIQEHNPLNLSNEMLKWRYRFYSFKDYDITKKDDVEKMKKLISKLGKLTNVNLEI